MSLKAELTCCGAAVLLEGRLQLCQAFQGGGGPNPFILVHGDCLLVALLILDSGLDRDNLGFKQSQLLSFRCSVKGKYKS